MNDLKRILYPIIRRQQQWRTWNHMLYWWCAVATVSGILLIRAQAGDSYPVWIALALGGALLFGTFIVLWLNTSRGRFDYQQLARDIETEHPELHATLLTAIEQRPDPQTGEYNFLQQRVIAQAKAAYEESRFCRVIPRGKLLALQGSLTLLFLMTCVCLFKLLQLPSSTLLAIAPDKQEVIVENDTPQAQLDQETAWIIEGIGHGHNPDLDHNGTSPKLIKTHLEITPENVDSFHFHGDPDTFPLTALIARPQDDKAQALLLAGYQDHASLQALKAPNVMAELMGMILRVRDFLDAHHTLIGGAMTALLTLILLLTRKLRQTEMETLTMLGCQRGKIAAVQAWEIGLVLGMALILALAATEGTLIAAREYLMTLIH